MKVPPVNCITFLALTCVALVALPAIAELPTPKPYFQAAASYGKLPLSFEANQGQAAPSVEFLSHGQGYTLLLRQGEAVLSLGSPRSKPTKNTKPTRVTLDPVRSIVRMRLPGANSKAVASHEDEQVTKTNYFLGSDPAKWHTNVPNYGKVRYTGVYPGVDLVYYGNQRQLEYDFVVAPAASPAPIRLNFSGQKHLSIAANGNLILQGYSGQATLHKPVVYQEKQGQRQSIPGSFKLVAHNTVAFLVGAYDHTSPLIIDPILVYSTYLGGSGALNGNNAAYPGDLANGIAVDADGSAYLVGNAWSSDFQVAPGAYQTTNKVQNSHNGCTVFVSKFNAAGTALIYSTFLGGTGVGLGSATAGGDFGSAIAIDSGKNVYLTGSTHSGDFPVTSGAFQTVNKSTQVEGTTVFITKLNAAGNRLVYSTFLGGTAWLGRNIFGDAGTSIAVDASGNAYVTGSSLTLDFPVTTGAFQTTNRGVNKGPSNQRWASNAFVAQLNFNGTALLYSTYLGGSGVAFGLPPGGTESFGDQGNAIAVDSNGNAFVTGFTYSADFPVTPTAFQSIYPGHNSASTNSYLRGIPNAFVTKLNSTGTALLYSTYLGGSGIVLPTTDWQVPYISFGDEANSIAVDKSGDAYVAGSTYSLNFPVTAMSLASVGDNSGAGFVTKLVPDGSALVFSTFLGGGGTSVNGLALADAGKVFVTGFAAPGFPETQDAYSKVGGAFVAKINAMGSAAEYATRIGGTGTDVGSAVALSVTGDAYVAGFTSSSNFPTTSGAFQSTNHAVAMKTTNAFVSRFALATEITDQFGATISLTASPKIVNFGHTVKVSASLTGAPGNTTPTGMVTFSGKGLPTASVKLDGSGTASWLTTPVAVGTYAVNVSYSGDGAYLSGAPPQAKAATFRVVVVGPPAALTVIAGAGQKAHVYGVPFSPLILQVSDSNGNPVAGNAVTFTGAGLAFTTASPITDGNGMVSVIPTPLVTGGLIATAAANGISQGVNFSLTVIPASLTATVHGGSRYYGAANPAVSVTFSGLVGSDILTATTQTTATPASPVGTYPVTATISGAQLANYKVTTINSILTVRSAILYIEAANEISTYGQAPAPPTAYSLHGFVNGESASVVSGSPLLSTSVTSNTHVGSYPISVQVGTLTAPNYIFSTTYSGMGSVQVRKAPLSITPTSFIIRKGDPIPRLTYTLGGFVNGDTQATAASGNPVLSAPATPTSPAGRYFILATSGTLYAQNYSFTALNGILTITSPTVTSLSASGRAADSGLRFEVAAFHPTFLLTYGDSITACAGVSVRANCYTNLLATYLGLDHAIDLAIGGNTTCAAATTQIFKAPSPLFSSDQPMRTLMIGTNDVVRFPVGGVGEATFNACHLGILSWLGTPSSSKQLGSAVIGGATGACTIDKTYALVPGIQCTSSGSTVPFQITTTNGPIYIWYRVINQDPGTFTYTIDNGPPVNLVTAFATPTALPVGYTGTVLLARIPTAAGNHTVLFQQTAAGTMGILAVGTPSSAAIVDLPYVVVADVPNQLDGKNQSTVDAYSADVRRNIQLLVGDGLKLSYAPVSKTLKATTAAGDMYDTFHPNDIGHAELFSAFLSGVTPLTKATSTSGTPVTLTAEVRLPSGTPVANGTVTFYNGGTILGTRLTNNTGLATLSTTTMPMGKDILSAAYTAQDINLASASFTLEITVVAVAGK